MSEVEFDIVTKYVKKYCDCGDELFFYNEVNNIFLHKCGCCKTIVELDFKYPLKREYIIDFCEKTKRRCTRDCIPTTALFAYTTCASYTKFKLVENIK